MNKYYILQLDPRADYEWDRCVLRNPMTGARPDLDREIARAVGGSPGSYLIEVNLEIKVLEQNLVSSSNTVELAELAAEPQIVERTKLAS